MKKHITAVLKHLNLISEHFTGKIVIHITNGNVGTIEKTETIR